MANPTMQKPREKGREDDISLHGRNQIMTKEIEGLGRKRGRHSDSDLELPEIVGVPDNSATPFESTSSVC